MIKKVGNYKKRTDIINHLFKKYNFDSYLEIGVRNAKQNFDLINCKFKEGVDPDPVTPVKFKMTSDLFFSDYVKNKKYDVIFVDGLHTEDQSYIDIINSIKHLNENGFIVMHDCNPPTEYHIRSYEDYLKTRGQWNGTVFKGFIKLNVELVDWNCFVVDEDFGCGVITKRKLKKEFPKLEKIPSNIGWEYFNENRNKLLNLISYEEYLNLF